MSSTIPGLHTAIQTIISPIVSNLRIQPINLGSTDGLPQCKQGQRDFPKEVNPYPAKMSKSQPKIRRSKQEASDMSGHSIRLYHLPVCVLGEMGEKPGLFIWSLGNMGRLITGKVVGLSRERSKRGKD